MLLLLGEVLLLILVVDGLSLFLVKSGYLDVLCVSWDLQDEVRVENFDEFVVVMCDFVCNNFEGMIIDFFIEVVLVFDVDDFDDEFGLVLFMMMYIVKGFEYDVVFVIGVEEDLILYCILVGEFGGLQEEWCLFYVGIIRVCKWLYLLFVMICVQFGEVIVVMFSCFLQEILVGFIDWW